MQITLDSQTWDVADETPLMSVLAELSDKAHAQGRLVSSLTVGERAVTDRDLLPEWLAKPVSEAGAVQAATKTVAETIQQAAGSTREFAAQLRVEGEKVVAQFRAGRQGLRELDQWLGGLADYLEWVSAAQAYGCVDTLPGGDRAWPIRALPALLEARETGDLVRLADLLEYELLPRLGA